VVADPQSQSATPSQGRPVADPAGGADDPSPVGRADAVDAQVDGEPIVAGVLPRSSDGGDADAAAAEPADPRLAVPPAPGLCAPALQSRVTTLLAKQRASGRLVLAVLRANRDYSNPAFMEKMVAHYGVQQYGSNVPREHFDPSALPEEDTWAALNRALENKVCYGSVLVQCVRSDQSGENMSLISGVCRGRIASARAWRSEVPPGPSPALCPGCPPQRSTHPPSCPSGTARDRLCWVVCSVKRRRVLPSLLRPRRLSAVTSVHRA